MIKGRLRSELRQPCCLVGRTDAAGQHQYSNKNCLSGLSVIKWCIQMCYALLLSWSGPVRICQIVKIAVIEIRI